MWYYDTAVETKKKRGYARGRNKDVVTDRRLTVKDLYVSRHSTLVKT